MIKSAQQEGFWNWCETCSAAESLHYWSRALGRNIPHFRGFCVSLNFAILKQDMIFILDSSGWGGVKSEQNQNQHSLKTLIHSLQGHFTCCKNVQSLQGQWRIYIPKFWTRAPPAQNAFNFMQFLAKFYKVVCSGPHRDEIPGSPVKVENFWSHLGLGPLFVQDS